MSRKTKEATIEGPFVLHSLDLRRSPAWRHLSNNAHRILDRLETEHMAHGGERNGKLTVTYTQFEEAGVRRGSIGAALAECEALGFARTTYRSQRGSGRDRQPSQYFLTHVVDRVRGKQAKSPPHDWMKIRTDDDAKAALAGIPKERPRQLIKRCALSEEDAA